MSHLSRGKVTALIGLGLGAALSLIALLARPGLYLDLADRLQWRLGAPAHAHEKPHLAQHGTADHPGQMVPSRRVVSSTDLRSMPDLKSNAMDSSTRSDLSALHWIGSNDV